MPVYHPNSPLGIFTAYLESTTCRCRDEKYRGKPFCRSCLGNLQDSHIKAINFARDDEARMEAFDDAKDWLESEGV